MNILRRIFGHSVEAEQSSTIQSAISPRTRVDQVTEQIERVKQLKREKRHEEVLEICERLMASEEVECSDMAYAPAPWSFDQAALAARRLERPDVERSAMERYLGLPGRLNPEYVAKFKKNLAKLQQNDQ